MNTRKRPLYEQADLTELVGVEHIPGSMPAGNAEREAARQVFYQQLLTDQEDS